MKRKMKLLGILVVSAIAILGYAETTHSESLDNLLLENIEALAAGETGSGGACVGRGSVVCPLTKEGVEHVHIYYSMPHQLVRTIPFLLYAEKSSNFCCLHGFSANNRAESEGAAIGHRFVPLSVPRSGAG